jgi:DnaJ-class molecular chaperone
VSEWIRITCPKCEGTGQVFKYDTAVFGKVMGCDAFQGRMYQCETCRGVGALLARPIETKTIDTTTEDKQTG